MLLRTVPVLSPAWYASRPAACPPLTSVCLISPSSGKSSGLVDDCQNPAWEVGSAGRSRTAQHFQPPAPLAAALRFMEMHSCTLDESYHT